MAHPFCQFQHQVCGSQNSPLKGDGVEDCAEAGRPLGCLPTKSRVLSVRQGARPLFHNWATELFFKLTSFCLRHNLVFLGKQPGKKASLARREQGRPLAMGRGARARSGTLPREGLETRAAAGVLRGCPTVAPGPGARFRRAPSS